jgi:geranylgeranyl pyrophosphate synthase
MTMPTPELPALLRYAQERTGEIAEAFLQSVNLSGEGPLRKAVLYAVMNGGKRVRPALVFGACQALGADPERAARSALAIELIHCYSLVHDDLPCMDDDDLRRGKPTTHKVFGEANALLAGDALQSLAFLALTLDPCLSATETRRQVKALALASAHMAVGQALDLEAEGKAATVHMLECIHQDKTGALIRACVCLGAIAAGADENDGRLQALVTFADRLGLAFQVHDDVLDVIGDTRKIGKPAGSDVARAKSTYPALLGLEAAQTLAVQLHDEAIAALAPLGAAADPLRELADFLVARDH